MKVMCVPDDMAFLIENILKARSMYEHVSAVACGIIAYNKLDDIQYMMIYDACSPMDKMHIAKHIEVDGLMDTIENRFYVEKVDRNADSEQEG